MKKNYTHPEIDVIRLEDDMILASGATEPCLTDCREVCQDGTCKSVCPDNVVPCPSYS